MKKTYLLFVALATFFTFTSKAQTCTPDPNFTADGIYPDSATNFASGTVGVAYTQNITVNVPQDTTVGTPPFVITMPFDSIRMVSMMNLPPGLNYMCSPGNCQWLGNTSGCSGIYGTPTTAGTYNLTIPIRAYVGGSTTAVKDTIFYYKIVIAPAAIGIAENTTFNFEVKQNFPNPFSGKTTLRFSVPSDDKVKVCVYNTLGKLISEKKIDAQKGNNEFEIEGKNLAGGLYFYTIEYKGRAITRRMMVNNY
jgi:hypothetical protein